MIYWLILASGELTVAFIFFYIFFPLRQGHRGVWPLQVFPLHSSSITPPLPLLLWWSHESSRLPIEPSDASLPMCPPRLPPFLFIPTNNLVMKNRFLVTVDSNGCCYVCIDKWLPRPAMETSQSKVESRHTWWHVTGTASLCSNKLHAVLPILISHCRLNPSLITHISIPLKYTWHRTHLANAKKGWKS